MTGQVAFLTQLLALTLLRLRCVLRSRGSGMLGSERVSGIRQQDTGHGLSQAGCSHQAGARVKSQHFRTELPWPARSAEISAQRRERERSRPAPADSGSECDHCESCVQSPAPESHTGPSQSGATASPGAGAVASQQEPPHPHSNIQTSERRGTMGTLFRK